MNRTITKLAKLDIRNMSSREKRAALKDVAAELKLTPNALTNLLRDARDASLTLTHVESMQLNNALLIALTRVALFNARRCYHA